MSLTGLPSSSALSDPSSFDSFWEVLNSQVKPEYPGTEPT